MDGPTRSLDYTTLKTRQRAIRDTFPQSLSLRTHRALSWLARAEREQEDQDARFLFLWIAFNAAYANEIGDRRRFSERRILLNFMERLIASDTERLLYQLVWKQYPESIRLLIDNRYVFQPFWDHVNGKLTDAEWRELFKRSKAKAHQALGRMETKKVFAVAFDRLYVLRNQMIHGGATWNSSVNRAQVRDGGRIMAEVVPIIIHLMMENPNQLWGDPCYPVVDV